MIGRTHAAYLCGTRASAITIEAEVRRGAPRLEFLGMSEFSARETRIRVRSALDRSELDWPRRAVVTVHPVEPRRSTACSDLAVAMALHAAVAPEVDRRITTTLLVGELSLGGAIRPIRGLLPQLIEARALGLEAAVVPVEQLAEAKLVEGVNVFGAATLVEAVDFLAGRRSLPRAQDVEARPARVPDLQPLVGHEDAQRTLRIAATGGHSVLLIGHLGTGKVMLARRVPSMLADLTTEQALVIAVCRSAAGLEVGVPIQPPFRAPHHTASTQGLLGGGDPVRPGEVTLAHGGVLLLDELSEFRRSTTEDVMRATSRGEVTIHHRGRPVSMPADALVVGAMSPCPCGHRGDVAARCDCSSEQIERHYERVPLHLFDMHVLLGPAAPPITNHNDHERIYRVASTLARLEGRPRPTADDVDVARRYRLG